MLDQEKYKGLRFEEHDDGVVLIEIGLAAGKSGTDRELHKELADVWLDVDADPSVRAVVITGQGEDFLPPVELGAMQKVAGNYEAVSGFLKEARDLVLNLINCDKPVISAINGRAVGAGLGIALLADITIVGDDVTVMDGHIPGGLAAGDHSVLIWPLLCGMAKAKLYLLTSDEIVGRDADQLGLVSKSVPTAAVREEALGLAGRLATGPQHAIRWTKRSLNHWLRDAGPAFETSVAAEMLGFMGPDHAEVLREMAADPA